MKDHKKFIFLAIVVILTYFFYLMVAPYLTFVLLGLVLIIAIKPLYDVIYKKIKHKKVSSWLTIIIVLLIIIIPSFLIGGALVTETANVFKSVNLSYIGDITKYAAGLAGVTTNLDQLLEKIMSSIGDFMIRSSVAMMNSLVSTVIGLFIMFSIMYYGFMEGEHWLIRVEAIIPFNPDQRKRLVTKIKNVIKSALFGEILISIIQGALGTVCFYIAGIPNAIFWGFVMAVLAFLPFVGTGCVWVPAAIIEMMNHNVGNSIFILIFGGVVITGIDYVIRPEIISGGSEIHPLIALIGAFGGLQIFGFIGLVLGPLMAALFTTIISFYYEDYVEKKAKAVGIKKTRLSS